MIYDLKPYPSYRDSGTPWLGEVPAHWQIQSLGSITSAVSQRNRPDLPLLSVLREKGVILRSSMSEGENHNYVPDDLSNYKVVKEGNLVVNKMKSWQGSLGVSDYVGIVSPAYYVFNLDLPYSQFAHTLLRSRPYVGFFAQASDGVRIGQWDLSIRRMKRIPVVIPPVEEQAAIVRALDYVDQEIRRYVHAKTKLLKLLKEQKQVIVSRAVTRGLDPNVRLKPSGLEWLAKIPEHWTLSRVKTEFRCLNHRRIPLSATERGEMTVRDFSYYGASGVIDKVDDYLFDDELLLIAEDGANLVLRNLPLAIIARGKFWVNNHAHILKPKHGNLEFLAHLMESMNYLPWISGAAQPKLTQDRLMGISIAVPSREEQDQIVAFIERNTQDLQAAIEKAEREVSLLREYRTRLIADVVTGKLDVRAVAANLPGNELTDAAIAEEFDELIGEEGTEVELSAEMEEVEV